ncbi:MAG: hypothetical protein DMF61_15740 [Blastocatellia bacterium AA13]|nr:MAG: hypothetical protein DMF61_15740 [Blastocatellia bacterium AA13]
MNCRQRSSLSVSGSVVTALMAVHALYFFSRADITVKNPQRTEPRIQITLIPPKGGGPDKLDRIAGNVSGVDVKKCKVVLFALGGNTWYVQPYTASPFTTIRDDGKWENDTHLGSEYAALLAEASYRPPDTITRLPQVGGDLLAIAKVSARTQPARNSLVSSKTSADMRTIQFSGYEWKVKSSIDLVGPGPNYFSDRKKSVEVDDFGRLHLRILQQDGRWNCAEIISTRSFGYGTYQFYIDMSVDNLDPRVILGLFTWSDAPDYSHREIDIEISRWGNAENLNAQFVVQPYTRPMNIVRYQIPHGLDASTHSFAWKPDSVFCRSARGINNAPSATASVIAEHTFTQDIPQAGGENARVNLWLMAGRPPLNGMEAEVIMSKFEFIPHKE